MTRLKRLSAAATKKVSGNWPTTGSVLPGIGPTRWASVRNAHALVARLATKCAVCRGKAPIVSRGLRRGRSPGLLNTTKPARY
jgi:hypothetical protein